MVADAMTGLGAFGPNRRDVTHAAASALRNWAFDLLCLAFSIKAARAHVPWWRIVLAWAAGTGSASLDLTPGGLGVVEAALTGALVAVGVPGRQALDRRAGVPGHHLLAGRSSRLGDLLAPAPQAAARHRSPGSRTLQR
jgi:uncharacterized membrane protein YbhN (UPF0104 family)